jgi:DHA3 family multidrug efflux protein-like MFS transporter
MTTPVEPDSTNPGSLGGLRTFHLLVANTLIAGTANNFLWFALVFWVYLETRSVVAASVIGGTYMLLYAASGMFFGTFVDRHSRKASMVLSSVGSLACFLLATLVYFVAPQGSLPSLSQPLTWVFVMLVLLGAIAGNLRSIALSTTVTLLVPVERHDKANGLVGTANGVAFALTSVFSGLAIGLLGMGPSLVITLVTAGLVTAHLLTIRIDNDTASQDGADSVGSAMDFKGAMRAVHVVPGLLALLLFSTFNNFLGGVFMALMDPYGLELVSVEVWGILLSVASFGFIVGGLVVATRGLGSNPVRTLLLVNVVMWTITILFPIRSSVVPLAIGFFLYLTLVPMAEASEQTIIQRLVPFEDQGRVFGFSQTIETAASPLTAFLIGPIAQAWVIPFMTDGSGADSIGGWFGTGPERGMALIFIVAGVIGLAVTIIALNSRAYRNLSHRYKQGKLEPTVV